MNESTSSTASAPPFGYTLLSIWMMFELGLVVVHRQRTTWRTVSPRALFDRLYPAANGAAEVAGDAAPTPALSELWGDYNVWYPMKHSFINWLLGGVPFEFMRGPRWPVTPVVPFFPARGVPDDFPRSCVRALGRVGYSWLGLDELLAVPWTVRGILTVYQPACFYEARVERGERGIPEMFVAEPSGALPIVSEARMREILAARRSRSGGPATGASKLHGAKQTSRGHGPDRAEQGALVQLDLSVTLADVAGLFHTELLPFLERIDPDPSRVRVVWGFHG